MTQSATKKTIASDARANAVDQLLSRMDVEDMVGQLLCVYLNQPDGIDLVNRLEEARIRPGGFLLTLRDSAKATEDVDVLQSWASVPMLVAANLESGTTGFLTDGDLFATPMQIAATGSRRHAERLGLFCAVKGRAVGVNWAFAPVVDLAVNPANPITNTRTYGADPSVVADMSIAFVTALQQGGVAACVKHWPGDGVDSRDQHLVTSVNDLPLTTWQETFGSVYAHVLSADPWSLMASHIALSSIGGLPDRFMPASLRSDLLQGLLREQMLYSGLIVSDNTLMAGFMRAMERDRAVPTAILAGCDMLLGSQYTERDFASLLEAVQSGLLPEERLLEAAHRVLTLKARLGLLDPATSSDAIAGASDDVQADFPVWKHEVARESITLMRSRRDLLPLDSTRTPKILLYVLGDEPTFYEPGGGLAARFEEGLLKRGFEVTSRRVPADGRTVVGEHSLQAASDVVVYFANHTFLSDSNVSRLRWSYPQAPEVPREATVPVVLVSVSDPYHLQDLPSADVAVNGYSPNEETVDAILAGLLDGAPFPGHSPVDPSVGHEDAL